MVLSTPVPILPASALFMKSVKKAADTKTVIEVQDNDHYEGTSSGVNIPVTHNGYLIAVIGISGSPDEVRKFAYLAEKTHPVSYPRTGIECRFPHFIRKRTYLVSYLLSEPDFQRNLRI